MADKKIEYFKYTINLDYGTYWQLNPAFQEKENKSTITRWYEVTEEDNLKYYLKEIYLKPNIVVDLFVKTDGKDFGPNYFVFKTLTTGNLPTSDNGSFGLLEPVEKDEILIHSID